MLPVQPIGTVKLAPQEKLLSESAVAVMVIEASALTVPEALWAVQWQAESRSVLPLSNVAEPAVSWYDAAEDEDRVNVTCDSTRYSSGRYGVEGPPTL